MQTKMTYITTVFGNRYAPFLITSVESIVQSASGAPIQVFVQDLDQSFMKKFSIAYPHVSVFSEEFDIQGTLDQRISSKVLFWEHALLSAETKYICLLDVDTLVLKDVTSLLDRFGDADILFTQTPSRQALVNTGVVIVRKSSNTLSFFRAWREEAIRITRDPTKMELAMSSAHRYGGADQMAWVMLLGIDGTKDLYEWSFRHESIRARGCPAELFNDFYYAPIASDAHVIHYKGHWQNMFFSLSQSRPSGFRSIMRSWNACFRLENVLELLVENRYGQRGASGSRFPFYTR